MNEVWNKLHLDLGVTKPNTKVKGEFEILKYIKVKSVNTSCGCTSASVIGNKLTFHIQTERCSSVVSKKYCTKTVSIIVRYTIDEVEQTDKLTASVDIENTNKRRRRR